MRARIVGLLLAAFFLLPAAMAQTAPMQVDGFAYSLRAGSIHTFICEIPQCGRVAVVSYQLQTDANEIELRAFEREKRNDYSKLAQEQLSGTKLHVSSAKRRKIKIFTLIEISMRMDVPGKIPHHRISGYLLGRGKKISLISSAATFASARRNFDVFAIALAARTDLGF